MEKHKKGIDVHSFDNQDGDQMLIATGKSCRDYESNWMEQQLLGREIELGKREAALRKAQQSMRKQNKMLRLDLERKDGEMAILQQKINFLVKSRVDLEEESELIKVQSKFNQSKLEQEIVDLKRNLTDLQLINQQASQASLKNQEQQAQIEELENTNYDLRKQNQLLAETCKQNEDEIKGFKNALSALQQSESMQKLRAQEDEICKLKFENQRLGGVGCEVGVW
eukprot:TRINITY_DN56997_c0_g1_i1.p2 TRINITY_DN56997_c0_g1~~TRINITY_DN56997_c0_g1_i1.p2  ORF type:complete len:225 (+),score=54.47 TRINITY_DN56997_c0_g1_i1:1262-1936(+)